MAYAGYRILLQIKQGVGANGEDVYYYEIVGDSSATKPISHVGEGSIFTETDTGTVYFFNETSNEWVEQFSFQG